MSANHVWRRHRAQCWLGPETVIPCRMATERLLRPTPLAHIPERLLYIGKHGKLAKRNRNLAPELCAYFRISFVLSSRTNQRLRRPCTLRPDQEPWFQEALRERVRGFARKGPTIKSIPSKTRLAHRNAATLFVHEPKGQTPACTWWT